MPLQSSWVERWLDEYCEPGEHEFRAYRPGAMVCSLCAKEEAVRGGTCLICGVPGVAVREWEEVDVFAAENDVLGVVELVADVLFGQSVKDAGVARDRV